MYMMVVLLLNMGNALHFNEIIFSSFKYCYSWLNKNGGENLTLIPLRWWESPPILLSIFH